MKQVRDRILIAAFTIIVALNPVLAANNATKASTPISQEQVTDVAKATTDGGVLGFLRYVVPSAGTLQNALQILMIIAVGAGVVAAYKYYLWWSSFEHTVVLRRKMRGGTTVSVEKARIANRDDGNRVIFRKDADFFSHNTGPSVPESDCMEQRDDGTFVLYGLQDAQGDITFAKPNVSWDDEDLDIDPASAQLRGDWIQQQRKSDRLRGEDSWFEKNSGVIVGTISIVMIVFAFGYFMDKVNTPAKQLANNAKKITKFQLKLAKELSRTGCVQPRLNATVNASAPNPGGTAG